MEDIENLPKELQISPRCLIALTGLNIETNQFHAYVWKSFSRGQPNDLNALRFINLPLDHPYSKAKAKHSSHYEWYQVKGIIKRHWMKKHLEELPAVVIVFFDLENNDPNWSEKVKECARRVELVRSNLISRATKIVVTLLQTHPINEIGGDINAGARIQELSESCQINVKNIYLLQKSEFMLSSVKRLEAELFGMAYNYYHNAAKRVKAHKSNLTKANQQLLYVRHDFKIAFFDELKQDSTLALKQYRQAYNNLVELKMSDAYLLELKVVAGFINFKICQIAFQMHGWDAISQFQRHIEIFKNVVGIPELAYEHEAWLSKQYEIFGKLFEEAIQFNFQASISRHPGLYFYEAGSHTINRRTLAMRLCSINTVSNISKSFPLPPPSLNQSLNLRSAVRVGAGSQLESLSDSTSPDDYDKLPEFFGQRPWWNAGQTLDTADLMKEREGIMALQAKEALVDHSELIIPLFAQASLYFERYGAKRMRSYPTYYIAEEFFCKGKFESALDHYSKIVDDFRRSSWAPLFASVCHRMYQCATLLGKNSLVIPTAMELLSNFSVLSYTEKEKIHELIFSTSNLSALGFDSDSAEIIDLTNLKSCVEVKAQFTKASFTVDEPVKLMVFLKSFTSFPLRFNGISVRLNHEALQGASIAQKSCASTDFALNSTGPTTTLSTSVCKWDQIFDLMPDEHLRAVVFTLDPSTLGSAVQVETIELGLTYANQIFHLRWFPSVALSTSENHPLPVIACNYITRLEEIKYHIADGFAKSSSSSSIVDEEDVILNANLTPLWEFFNNQLSAELLPKASNLEMSLRHTPPVLCNEKYAILCQILNTEAGDITDLTISAMLAGGGVNDATLEPTSTSLDAPQRLGSVAVGQMAGQNLNPASLSGDELFSHAFIASNISQGVDFVCPIFVHCPKVAGDRSLRVDAHYNLLTHFPTPGVKVLSWRSNGSISLLSSDNNTEASSGPTLTRCVQSKRVQLSVTPPFEITSRLLSLNHEPITTVVTGKSFILEVSLTNCSPWPISVENSLLNLVSNY
ncbi:unnamed protein product [Hymenolepis diminuta]|uniref:Foie-gras_1 domain-containing protein n=1 Tax=Hymenolepis diminuta TaxID=6216 RepID=A0A158QC97_HYMDI|nr:unnamed protein product [Hymenolepis diminuta]